MTEEEKRIAREDEAKLQRRVQALDEMYQARSDEVVDYIKREAARLRRKENRGCGVIGFLPLVGILLKLGQWTFG